MEGVVRTHGFVALQTHKFLQWLFSTNSIAGVMYWVRMMCLLRGYQYNGLVLVNPVTALRGRASLVLVSHATKGTTLEGKSVFPAVSCADQSFVCYYIYAN